MGVSLPQGPPQLALFPLPPTGTDAPLELGDPPPQGPPSQEAPAPLESTEEGADTERCAGGAQAVHRRERRLGAGVEAGRVRVGGVAAFCTCCS